MKICIFLIYPTALLMCDSIQTIFEFNADRPFVFHIFAEDLEVSIFTGRFVK